MRKTLAVLAVVLSLGMTAALDAEAKRLGGGKSSGMQRQNTSQPASPGSTGNTSPGAPAQSAAPATAGAAAGAAAAPARRSWMGPIAGLAAGLGLAALASHLGFGEALANMMMIGLLVVAVLAVIAFVMRKRAAAQQPAMAGMPRMGGMDRTGEAQPSPAMFRGGPAPAAPQGGSLIGSRLAGGIGSGLGGTAPAAIPADFDVAGFVRNAKANFMALQSANDARDMNRLRDYLTPEMFEHVSADIAERGDAPQSTEVFGLEAQVLEVAQDAGQHIVSVRFTGSIRDQAGAEPEALDEVWHLAKPTFGNGGWVIAGIQQA